MVGNTAQAIIATLLTEALAGSPSPHPSGEGWRLSVGWFEPATGGGVRGGHRGVNRDRE
jgi:hypothetical protein